MLRKELLLYQNTFLDPPNLTQEIFKNFDFENNYYSIKIDDKDVCSAFILDKKISVYNKPYKALYLLGLSTKVEFRNKGFARKILTKIIKEKAKENNVFLFLYPFPIKKDFYFNFGFNEFSYIPKIDIKNLLISGAKEKENIGVLELKNFYERLTKNQPCHQKLTLKDFKDFNKKVKAYNGNTVGFYYKDYLYAFYALDGDFIENSLVDFEFIGKMAIKEPFVSSHLLRPLNHLKFIKIFKGNFSLEKDFSISLYIKDEILGNSKIKVIAKNKKIKIYNGFKGDNYVALSVKELTDYILFNKTDKNLPKINKTIFDYSFFEKF